MVKVRKIDNMVEIDINGVKIIVNKQDALSLNKAIEDVCITKWYNLRDPEMCNIKKSVRGKNCEYRVFSK